MAAPTYNALRRGVATPRCPGSQRFNDTRATAARAAIDHADGHPRTGHLRPRMHAPSLTLGQALHKRSAADMSLLQRTRTTRLAARGGRLHRPDDPQAGRRDADVTLCATASVGHRTAASRGETNGRTPPTKAVPWHDRFHHSGLVVPAIPMPRMRSRGAHRLGRAQNQQTDDRLRRAALIPPRIRTDPLVRSGGRRR
jgi:hypothetical protein